MEMELQQGMLGIVFHSRWEKATTAVRCEPSLQEMETLPRRLQTMDTLTYTTWGHHSEPIGWGYSDSVLLLP